MFPPPYARKPPERTLAWLEDRTIRTEDGKEYTVINGWDEIHRRLDTDNLLILCARLIGTAWWHDALAAGASPSISRKAGVSGLRVAGADDKRQKRWLIRASTWGEVDGNNRERGSSQLRALRGLYDACGQGDFPTPSSLGLATMGAWWEQREPRLWRPSRTIDRIIRENIVGGRVDTLRAREQFEECYEVDINSAYAWAAQRVPAGGCYAVSPRFPSTVRAAFYRCGVDARRARRGLLAGPLPVRTGERVTYPTEGAWAGWYWSEEVQAALEVGFRVDIECGFEWPEWSRGLENWARTMHEIRRVVARDAAGMVKLATVAGIGRFIGRDTTQELTEEETNVPYLDSQSGFMDPLTGGISPYYLKEKSRSAPELLPHVGSYILAMVRLATYRAAIEERDALVATNYDAYYTLRKPNWESQTGLGEWKWKKLTDARVEKPRWIESNEKVRRPGVAA